MIDFKNGSLFKLKKEGSPVPNDILSIFVENEEIIGYYKGLRDYVVFTNKRIIVVNVQGITGKKKDYSTLPYSKVQAFSIETAGTFDIDSELEVYFSSLGKLRFEFTDTSDIIKIGKVISNYIL